MNSDATGHLTKRKPRADLILDAIVQSNEGRHGVLGVAQCTSAVVRFEIVRMHRSRHCGAIFASVKFTALNPHNMIWKDTRPSLIDHNHILHLVGELRRASMLVRNQFFQFLSVLLFATHRIRRFILERGIVAQLLIVLVLVTIQSGTDNEAPTSRRE